MLNRITTRKKSFSSVCLHINLLSTLKTIGQNVKHSKQQLFATAVVPLNMMWYFPFSFPPVPPPTQPFFSPSISVSSLAAVQRWGESNLNYVSQGPISLLPAVGISGLLISYQPVIGLRSRSPSDIPQIYDTPDRLRGGWGGGGLIGGRVVPLVCLPTLYSTKYLPDHKSANSSSSESVFKITPAKKNSVVTEAQQELMPCVNYQHAFFLPFSPQNKLWNCNQSF